MRDCITDAFKIGTLKHIADSDPRVALYTKLATFDKTTQTYTPDNEVRGVGYQAGGMKIEGGEVVEDSQGFVLVMHSPVWQNATIVARGAILYLAGDGNRAVRVFDFGRDVTSTNDQFRVKFPGLADGGVLGL